VAPPDARREELAARWRVSPLAAQVLINRGLTTAAAGEEYLRGDLACLGDPRQMRDMDAATELLVAAIQDQRLIRVYGDYDVDGVAGTALLVRAISALGGIVDYYLPHRVQEGYGLHLPPIEAAAAAGVGLLLTVDCGISASAEVQRAKDLGLQVIVTDHHHPEAKLPPADAILNPRRPDCAYPFKELSGVGVAFKLICATAQRLGLPEQGPLRFLDLVALGTVADVVPLLGENRLLVRFGLEQLRRTRKLGLAALIDATQLIADQVSSHHVAFVLAPRLNAPGRVDHANASVRLLLSAEAEEATALADQLCEQNTTRRRQEKEALEAALAAVEQEVDLDGDRAIVLASPDWHPGVIGIVASRLVERFHRPVMLIALDGEHSKGSGRSIEGFNLWESLHECRSHLTRFGGHAMAAGITIDATRVAAFREAFVTDAGGRLDDDGLRRRLAVEAEVAPGQLDLNTMRDMQALAPFGAGNPPPLFVTPGLTVVEAKRFGSDGSHLRLTLQGRGNANATRGRGPALTAVWFGRGEIADRLTPGEAVDICFEPEIDTWNGQTRLRLKLRDLGLTDPAVIAAGVAGRIAAADSPDEGGVA
jgi:single-stranded-DNA-specific exonuclease